MIMKKHTSMKKVVETSEEIQNLHPTGKRTKASEKELLVELKIKPEHQKRFLDLDRKLEKEGFALGAALWSPDRFGIGCLGGGEVASGLTLDEVEAFLIYRHRAKSVIADLQEWLETPGHGAGRRIHGILGEEKFFKEPCCKLPSGQLRPERDAVL